MAHTITPTGSRVSAVRSTGLRTRVMETGSVEGEEAIVLIHGAPGSADDWRLLLPHLAPLGRVVAFDLPGFGAAERPRDWEYSPNSFANFVAGALGELRVRRAHLVLSDLGGLAGLYWAAAHRDAFASAVLINTGVLVDYRWHLLARLHQLPALGLLVAAGGRLGVSAAMRLYDRQVPAEELARWRAGFDWGTRRALLRFYRATPSSALTRIGPDLARLDRPARVIWGVHDRFVPVEQAERQRESFPSAELTLLEDSGHCPHLDDPERVAAVAVPFLEGQVAA